MADTDLELIIKMVDEASAQINTVKKGIKELSDEASSAGKTVSDLNSSLDGAKAPALSFGDALKNAQGYSTAFAAGLLAVGAGAVALGTAVVKSASNLNESINAVNVVFGEASSTVLDFGKTAAQSAGLSRTAFNEAVVPIGSMLQNMGASADEAAQSSIDLAARAADMASVFNTDLGSAITAIQAGLRGEADPLERFGVGLSETAVKAYAVSQGLVGVSEDMDAQTKMTARLGLFFEQTNRVAGDFANTSDELANSVRIVKADFKNAIDLLGTSLLPIVTEVIKSVREWVDAQGGLTGMMQDFMDVVGAVTGFLVEHQEIIYIVAGAIVGALVPAGWLAVTVMWALASAVLAVLGPFILVGAAIGAAIFLIVKGVQAFISLMPTISVVWTAVWEAVKAALTVAWNAIVGALTGLWQGIVAIWDGIKAVISTVVAFIVGLVILAFEALGIDIIAVWEDIKVRVSDAFNAVRDTIATVLGVISTVWQTVWSAISTVASTVWNTIVNVVKTSTKGITDFFLPAIEVLRSAWDGFWGGAAAIVSSVWETVKGTVKSGINWIIEKINSLINSINFVTSKAAIIPGIKALTIPTIPLLAKGGNIVGDGDVIVGERGPERLSLPRGARVTPLTGDQAGGGSGVTIIIQNPMILSDEDIVEKIGDPIMRVFKQHFAAV